MDNNVISRKSLYTLFFLGLVVFSLNIWQYDLWPADEPRFGQIAREILQTGDWIVLHVNGQPYDEKPPLLFWCIALISAPFGDVSAATARIPSVFAAIIVVLLTYLLGTKMYGERIGFWSGILLITSSRFWWQARTCQTDMLLTAFMTVSLWSLWCFVESRRRLWLIVFYGGIIGGLYTKGPPALVFPALCITTFFWKKREERRHLHLALGFSASVFAVLAWLIPARLFASNSSHSATEQILLWDVMMQTLGRFVFGISKAQPPWYFIINLPVDWLPWTLFLSFVLPWVWHNRREDARMRFLLAWIVPAFIFFSISIGKRQIYLLPIFPAVSILLARGVLRAVDSNRIKLLRTIACIWAGLLFLLAVLIILTPFIPAEKTIELGYWKYMLPGVLLLCVSDAFRHASPDNAKRLHHSVARTTIVLYGCVALAVLPSLNTHKSARFFCEPLRKLVEAGTDFRLYSVGFSREEYVYHSKHFHQPVFTDLLPVTLPENLTLVENAEKQKYLRERMTKAVLSVEINSIDSIRDDEVEMLRKTLREQIEKDDKVDIEFVKHFEEALEREVASFAQTFRSPGPAFLFIQEADWRWLVAFEPAFRECPVLRHQSVGRRDVLLVANADGAALVQALYAPQ